MTGKLRLALCAGCSAPGVPGCEEGAPPSTLVPRASEPHSRPQRKVRDAVAACWCDRGPPARTCGPGCPPVGSLPLGRHRPGFVQEAVCAAPADWRVLQVSGGQAGYMESGPPPAEAGSLDETGGSVYTPC